MREFAFARGTSQAVERGSRRRVGEVLDPLVVHRLSQARARRGEHSLEGGRPHERLTACGPPDDPQSGGP
eukprot:15297368-Alexandrium_andersonii.AAC.1